MPAKPAKQTIPVDLAVWRRSFPTLRTWISTWNPERQRYIREEVHFTFHIDDQTLIPALRRARQNSTGKVRSGVISLRIIRDQGNPKRWPKKGPKPDDSIQYNI